MNNGDILLDENFDLIIKDGDIVVGESINQSVKFIINAEKGQFKQYPTLGVGMRTMIDGNFTQSEIDRRIQSGLKADGLKLVDYQMTSENETITTEIYEVEVETDDTKNRL